MIITSTTPTRALLQEGGGGGEKRREEYVGARTHPALGRFFRPRAVKQVVPVKREREEKNKREEDGRETGGKIIARNERREEGRGGGAAGESRLFLFFFFFFLFGDHVRDAVTKWPLVALGGILEQTGPSPLLQLCQTLCRQAKAT